MLDKQVVTRGKYGNVVRIVEYKEPWISKQMLWKLLLWVLFLSYLLDSALTILLWELFHHR